MGVHHRYCIACDQRSHSMNKEHFWPRWLIQHTRTDKTGVKWGGRKINPNSGKIPICTACNTALGKHLETPAKTALLDVENGRGLSDYQAEILTRWMWKFIGLQHRFNHPYGSYTQRYTLRDRVLRPIDEIRPGLSFGVSLIEQIDPELRDSPMGIDTPSGINAVSVAGVFSKVAMAVVRRDFEYLLPTHFSFWRFGERDPATENTKLFFPRVGFKWCTQAVYVMAGIGPHLVKAHDDAMALEAAREAHN